MTKEQIIKYLQQRRDNIKRNVTIAQEQNNKQREQYCTAQYIELSDILKSIR